MVAHGTGDWADRICARFGLLDPPYCGAADLLELALDNTLSYEGDSPYYADRFARELVQALLDAGVINAATDLPQLAASLGDVFAAASWLPASDEACEAEKQWAWSITARLAADAASMNDLIAEARSLHQSIANKSTGRRAVFRHRKLAIPDKDKPPEEGADTGDPRIW